MVVEDWTGAVERFGRVLPYRNQADPKLPFISLILLLRGQAYMHIDSVKAMQDFESAAIVNPRLRPLTRAVRAEVLLERGKLYEALVEANIALAEEPRQPFFLCTRAGVWFAQRQYSKAVSDLSTAMDNSENPSQFLASRGGAKARMGDLDGAGADLEAALAVDKRDAIAYNNRSNLCSMRKEFRRALTDCSKAIALRPKYSKAYSSCGFASLGLGHIDQAMEFFNKAISLDLRDAGAFDGRATAWRRIGEIERAIGDYTQAINLGYGAEAFCDRGDVRMMRRDIGGAVSDYSSAIATDPSHLPALLKRGGIFAETGRRDQACADFRHVAQMSSNPDLRMRAVASVNFLNCGL
jgi:tetratricopeptide (TPR) repeat protein